MNRKTTSTLLIAAIVYSTSLTQAKTVTGTQTAPKPETAIQGFQAEFGMGIGLPGGGLGGELGDLTDMVAFQIPIDLNLGYRLGDQWAVGMYWSVIPALANADFIPCGSGHQCGAFGLRIGLHVQYHVAPRAALDPWISLGAGWDLQSVEEIIDDPAPGVDEASLSVAVNGPTYLESRIGLDFQSGPGLSYGPYVGFSLGSYQTLVTNCDLCETRQTSLPIDNTTLHHWISFGFQGRLTIID